MSWLETALTPGLRDAVKETQQYATALDLGVMYSLERGDRWQVSLSAAVPTGKTVRVASPEFHGMRFRSSPATWPRG